MKMKKIQLGLTRLQVDRRQQPRKHTVKDFQRGVHYTPPGGEGNGFKQETSGQYTNGSQEERQKSKGRTCERKQND